MKKLPLDLISILILALLVAGAILIWGDYAGIKTPEARSVALGAMVLAIIASFDRLGRWSDAVRALGKCLHFRKPEMAGTTQDSVLSTRDAKSRPLTSSIRFAMNCGTNMAFAGAIAALGYC